MKFNEMTATWFHQLITYLQPQPTDDSTPIPFSDLRISANMTPNQRNMRNRMIPTLERIWPEYRVNSNLSPDDTNVLRGNLLAHAIAVQELMFKDEFRKGFSKTGDPNDVSAASSFFSKVRQACEQAKQGFGGKYNAAQNCLTAG